jgi:P27 family predicted phage terminase small subunit
VTFIPTGRCHERIFSRTGVGGAVKMGKRGPKPTPTRILQMRGSWRGNSRLSEPQLPAQTPEPPQSLIGEALAEWSRICPVLARAGVLTAADRAVLVTYCQIWSDLQEIEQSCRKDGKLAPLMQTAAGNWVQNPIIGLRNTLRKQLREYAALLGITPADRSRVSSAGPVDLNDVIVRIVEE